MINKKIVDAIQRHCDESGCICCILERENGPADSVLSVQSYEALTEFVKGSGMKLIVLERPESEIEEDEFFSYEISDYQIESLCEFFPELDIQKKLEK